jgi:hypothetical protein
MSVYSMVFHQMELPLEETPNTPDTNNVNATSDVPGESKDTTPTHSAENLGNAVGDVPDFEHAHLPD